MTTQTEEQRKAFELKFEKPESCIYDEQSNTYVADNPNRAYEAFIYSGRWESWQAAIAANASKPEESADIAIMPSNNADYLLLSAITKPDVRRKFKVSIGAAECLLWNLEVLLKPITPESPDLKAAGFHDSGEPVAYGVFYDAEDSGVCLQFPHIYSKYADAWAAQVDQFENSSRCAVFGLYIYPPRVDLVIEPVAIVAGNSEAMYADISVPTQLEIGDYLYTISDSELLDAYQNHLSAVQEFLGELCETMGVELPENAKIQQTLPLIIAAAERDREIGDAYQKLKAKVDSAEVVYQVRFPELWQDCDKVIYNAFIATKRILYTSPPSAQALVELALRDAAEVAKDASHESVVRKILALKPNPSALRDICLKVASAVGYLKDDECETVVDRVLESS